MVRELALTRGDRDPRRPAHARHHADVVVPVARLLEPAEVEGLDQMREALRVLHRPAAIGVHGQDELRPRRLARNLDALGVLLRRQSADLELATRHPGLAVRLHLAPDVGVRLAVHVIAPDGDDREARARASEEGAHALAPRLAAEVPEGAVHAGDRFEQRLPLARRVGEREQRLPDSLALEDAQARDARGELLVDQAHDLATVLTVVAVVHLADEPRVGAHAGDDGAALADGVRAAAEVLRQRDLDRDRLDAVDAHGAVPTRPARPVSSARSRRASRGPGLVERRRR